MGSRWGINRTVAQIHALLYVSDRPLNAEEIATTLGIARSNVSTSLRELQGWGIVRVVHKLGDRRDYFESMGDVWEMFQVILEERKRREMDPTIALLRSSVSELNSKRPSDIHARQRIQQMLEFFQTMEGAYQESRSLSMQQIRRLLGVRQRLRKLLFLARSS